MMKLWNTCVNTEQAKPQNNPVPPEETATFTKARVGAVEAAVDGGRRAGGPCAPRSQPIVGKEEPEAASGRHTRPHLPVPKYLATLAFRQDWTVARQEQTPETWAQPIDRSHRQYSQETTSLTHTHTTVLRQPSGLSLQVYLTKPCLKVDQSL